MMNVVRIISIFIIFVSAFGFTITYIGYHTISPSILEFEDSINNVNSELKEYIHTTVDDTSQSLVSVSKSLQSASSSTYLAGDAAHQASDDFGKVSKILSTFTFGLFNPAQKYEQTLSELGGELKDTGDNLHITAQNIENTRNHIEDFKKIESFTKFLDDTSNKVHYLNNCLFYIVIYLLLQQLINLSIGISLYIVSNKLPPE
ncbi:MAG: hypothetical protein KAH93_00410 [Candidatus Aenigmarchaeota archaeon]|nr:hypothetical protein [Candidatus Aenigmarchaeota archaeon]